MRVSEVINFVP